MTIQFPLLPITSQTYADAGVSWRWDGEKWLATSAANPLSPPVALVVAASQTLPQGFSGTVMVEQTGPVTIALPPLPSTGQQVTVKDALGQAATYPITVAGTIEGATNMIINFAYGWVALSYAGTQWVQI